MVDYVSLAATAKRLITANGREVTFVRFNRTAADAAKPWKGAADPRTDPDASETLDAVFVEPSSAVRLGISTVNSELVKRSTQILIAAPGSDFAEDLSTFEEVIDSDGVKWRITTSEKLKPAEVTLLYFIGVAR
jgi:hypothetical protein